jgi:hypothetical protein
MMSSRSAPNRRPRQLRGKPAKAEHEQNSPSTANSGEAILLRQRNGPTRARGVRAGPRAKRRRSDAHVRRVNVSFPK